MKAHIDAIVARLASLNLAGGVHYVSVADHQPMPYAFVWGPPWGLGEEASVCGTNQDLDALLGVTAVGANPSLVMTLQQRIRTVLTPRLGAPNRLAVPGRSAWLTYDEGAGQPVAVDRDVTIADTGLHPAFSVEMYRLRSTPE